MRVRPVLVIGATGYVGGRLVPRLLQEGHRVRALARSRNKLAARSWSRHPMVELFAGNVLDQEALRKACHGCGAAFYLVHSMDPYTRDFVGTDRRAAENMAAAAAAAGLERIIYLGGLTPREQGLSPHLASRAEVGRILQSGPVPVTVLRAAIILGSGSASFEIIRYLMDRLPVMPVPTEVRNLVQPISIRNVLGYLAGVLEHEETVGGTYDICGPETLRYEDLFRMYAEEAGLGRRWILRLPFMTPRLASYLIHLVTPVHAALARPLTEGLRHNVVCLDHRLRRIIPQDLMDCRRTIRRILVKEQQQIVETSWTDAGSALPHEWVQTGDAAYAGGAVIALGYDVHLGAEPERVWAPLVRIGGKTGWYFADFLWRLRGWADKLAGGVGSARGRRHSSELAVGDALDFWRVVEVRPNQRLLLMGEMKVPGEMVLDFRLRPLDGGATELQMIGRFVPKGLWGLAYWYALLPFHTWIYKGLLTRLAGRVGAPVLGGPVTFRPRAHNVCPLDKEQGEK
ncbi:MAG: SDR family oxidoreductase [Thermodesulfobacteriota bacterium]